MQTMTRRDLLSLLAAAALPPPPATAQPIIRTILRDVKPSAIDGPILIHEHLSLGGTDWGIERPASKWYDDVDLIANEVAACRASGVRCIVDMGTSDLGRRIGALRTIATQSNMLIVASGGLHGYPPGTPPKPRIRSPTISTGSRSPNGGERLARWAPPVPMCRWTPRNERR